MKIIDISWPLTQTMTEYKNADLFSVKHITKSPSGAMETHLCVSSHTGTHVDAPAHFIADGQTIDKIPLEKLMGSCTVLDLTFVNEKITKADLESHDIKQNQIILIKTTNSFLNPLDRFNENFIYIAQDAAHYLVEKGIKALGFDYLGIERNQPDHSSHKALMMAHIPIIEGLRLVQINPGDYFFSCMPLLLPGADAAPARAVLIENIL